jgi:hypothetical protein
MSLDQEIMAIMASLGALGPEAIGEVASLITPSASPSAPTTQTLDQLVQSLGIGAVTGAGTTATRGGGGYFPFDQQYASDVTLQFGQTGPFGAKEVGNDYGMPVGTPIYAPFGGYISVTQEGKQGWGNRVLVRDPATGLTFGVGHLNRFGPNGTSGYVQAGQIIGYSGGAKDDPNSGSSDGAHVEVQLIDPSGHYIDPHGWMQQLLTSNDPGLPPGTLTPDGHYLLQGSQDETFYNLASLAWEKTYGTLPPWSVVAAMQQSGVTNLDQVQQILWGMPSQFAGTTLGQAETVRDAANKIAQKLWGRPVPDSYIQELLSKGITNAADIQLAIESSPAGQIPKEYYQPIFDQANTYTQGIWNSTPSPDQITSIYQQGPLTPGQAQILKIKQGGQPSGGGPTA